MRAKSCGSRPRRSSGCASGWANSIARAADLIYRSSGSVIVTGMGKAGLVGQKLAATLASTGTRAFPLHPAEAVHGDLGRIRADDIVIALSQSGETEEVLRLIPALRRLGACLVAITERASSTLGQAADLCVALGPIEEACPLGLAPSASTTVLMAVGDALALLVSRMRDFTADDFALYHPAGSLGRKLDPGRGGDAHRPAAPPGARRRDGPRRLRAAGRSAPPLRGGPDRGRGLPSCWGSSPTATWPGCSKSAGRPSWTGHRRGHDGRPLSRSASAPPWPRRSS